MGLFYRIACSLLFLLFSTGLAWAQNPAVIPIPRNDSWWTNRHAEVLHRVEANPRADLVFVGDSITQNYEKTGPSPNEVFAPTWQEFFAPHNALNLGYSGDQTQNVLWRLAHGEVRGLSPTNVVVLIGTNNSNNINEPETAEQVASGVEAVVDALHTALPKSSILLIEILPSGISMVKSVKDAVVNQALRSRYEHSGFVRCLDLSPLYVKDAVLDTSLFYDPQLVPSRPPLHPNTQGQRLMAQAIAKALYRVTPAK